MLHTNIWNENQSYVGHINVIGTKYICEYIISRTCYFLFLPNGTAYGHEISDVNINLVPHVQKKKSGFFVHHKYPKS